MPTHTEIRVLRVIATLPPSPPDISVVLTVSGLTTDQLSDVLASLRRQGCIREYFDFGDGEVSVLSDTITSLGRRVLALRRA